MTSKRRTFLFFLASLALPAPAADLPLLTWQGQTMGSTYTVKLVAGTLTEPQLQDLKREIEACLKETNRQLSHYQADSELSRFNRAAANEPLKMSAEFERVVRHSLELNRRSDGAFDPTLGPLINLWGFGEKTTAHAVPSEAELLQAREHTGCHHLHVSPAGELVKDIPGLSLNLSSPAKGFGVDEMARVLRAHDLTNFYVAIAGDIYTSGYNHQSRPWQVGISAPLAHWRIGDPALTVIPVSDRAVSTSGDYQKFFLDAQGRRLGHILDPKTGAPVQHRLGSVTVVAENCMVSSSLATTLFVLGQDDGARFIESWTNAAALFVVRDPAGNFRSIPSSRFKDLTGYTP